MHVCRKRNNNSSPMGLCADLRINYNKGALMSARPLYLSYNIRTGCAELKRR